MYSLLTKYITDTFFRVWNSSQPLNVVIEEDPIRPMGPTTVAKDSTLNFFPMNDWLGGHACEVLCWDGGKF